MMRCAIQPGTGPAWLSTLIEESGGVVSEADEAQALFWYSSEPAGLRECLDRGTRLEWVQLPMAGIERFRGVLDDRYLWTCPKGVYADVVAEHALGLALSGLRGIAAFARSSGWGPASGRNLLDANVVILGGGGIAARLLDLLKPFNTRTTVVRRAVADMPGVHRVVGIDRLHAVLPDADLVVVALALTPGTHHIIGEVELGLMARHAWLVNVARGEHVDTDALTAALAAGRIGGAALDVTDPEPLPAGHPLWTSPRCVITPHTANTPAMLQPRLAAFTRANIERFRHGEPLHGLVDVAAGY